MDTGVDTGVDEGVNPNNSAPISQLRDEVAYLREENRRKDGIILQQAMTVQQLTAGTPSEAPGGHEMAAEPSEGRAPLRHGRRSGDYTEPVVA